MKEERPWGFYEVLLDEEDHKVKRITVKPGKRLSKQYHESREEYWTIVSGSGLVLIGDTEIRVEPGATYVIPRHAVHRVRCTGVVKPLIFIEVQLGDYFGEDDIVRLEDDFGRE